MLCCSLKGMLLEENKPLASLTTFGIGGPARFFIEARSEEDVASAAEWATQREVPLFVLGGGSNLLVSDTGFPGLVVQIALKGIHSQPGRDPGQVLYWVAAGEVWDDLVRRACAENSAGIECLAGIPGTVGGTPVQNVGAYGQEVSSTIERVRAFDLQQNAWVEFANSECGFAYRRSRFNSEDRGRYVVTQVVYSLERNGAPTLRYADLQRAFPAQATLSLAEVAEGVRRIRQSKGMLMIDGDADCRSAGSFFKNPIVPKTNVVRITAAAGQEPPSFPAGPGLEDYVKISAAWLIERAGFRKGYSLGLAGLSSRHTLALINRGGARAADILALADQIRAGVAERFGVDLQMEPVLLGF